MNENKSWSSMGEEIRDAVEKALREGDFTKISDVAVNTVTGTVKNVGSMVGHAVSDGINGNYTTRMVNITKERKRQQEEQRTEKEAINRRLRVPFKPIGRVSNILYKVFGGIGIGLMSLISLVFLALLLFGVGIWWTGKALIVALTLLAVFFIMVQIGRGKGKRLKRAERYLQLTGNNHYINIDELALHTNTSKKGIVKDLKRMLADGFFPEGHLDCQESCLMLDEKIYREYLQLEKQRKIQEQEQRVSAQKKDGIRNTEEINATKKESTINETEENNRELTRMIAEGQDCIRRLRDMNDNIAGEEISAKLFRLENLLKEIFERLKEHPEQLPQMQKFLNYYLPTTLKLVSAYEDFDSMSEQGDDIIEAKQEIEKTLDTINSAFAELLNKLFRETAYDVTTDAQVLQTMLAKEGLTREREFDKLTRT